MEGFTIRISGAPPPRPGADGGEKGGGGGKTRRKKPPAPPPGQQRHTLPGLLPTTSVSDLDRRVFDAYGVPRSARGGLTVRYLGGFPPRELGTGKGGGGGRDDLEALGVGPNESLIVRFEEAAGTGAGDGGAAAADAGTAAGTASAPGPARSHQP